MTVIPALRRLNRALTPRGVRICEACGQALPLTPCWFCSPDGRRYRYVCVRCYSRPRRVLWGEHEDCPPHPKSVQYRRRAFARILRRAGIAPKGTRA